MRSHARQLASICICLASMATASSALGQIPISSAVTYQGRLKQSGAPVNTTADLQFRLFNASTGGTQIGTMQAVNNASVADGYFGAVLDFGGGAFSGGARWLQIAVRSPAGSGTFITLTPRQPMTAAPYALQTRGMCVDDLNRVGMGTASPQRALHVAAPESVLQLQSTSPSAYTTTEYRTDAHVWHTGVGGSAVGNDLSGAYYIFDLNVGQSRLMVDPSGRVGIGTTNPLAMLHVTSQSGPGIRSEVGLGFAMIANTAGTSSTALSAHASSFTGNTTGVSGSSSSTEGRGVYGVASAASGVNYGVVGESRSPNGYDFFATGDGINYGAESSRRWKRNLEPIDDPLGMLARLRGVYFDWDAQHGGHHDVGMIAEEVGAVLPEVVAYEENGIDASGMDYSKLTPLLVEAIKSLRAETQAHITALQQDNQRLQQRVAALEGTLSRRTADR